VARVFNHSVPGIEEQPLFAFSDGVLTIVNEAALVALTEPVNENV